MGNASKALIMAGGVLITILIISLSLYMLTAARGAADASEKMVTASQVEAFNRFFVNYPNEVTGLDVYNIIGKIDDIRNDADSICAAPTYTGASKSELNDTREMAKRRYGYTYEYGDDGAIISITFSPHADATP